MSVARTPRHIQAGVTIVRDGRRARARTGGPGRFCRVDVRASRNATNAQAANAATRAVVRVAWKPKMPALAREPTRVCAKAVTQMAALTMSPRVPLRSGAVSRTSRRSPSQARRGTARPSRSRAPRRTRRRPAARRAAPPSAGRASSWLTRSAVAFAACTRSRGRVRTWATPSAVKRASHGWSIPRIRSMPAHDSEYAKIGSSGCE